MTKPQKNRILGFVLIELGDVKAIGPILSVTRCSELSSQGKIQKVLYFFLKFI